jgi:hypothetical protein
LGDLATPKCVQKLQTALHAKTKAEVDYRFYALYDASVRGRGGNRRKARAGRNARYIES